jgi:hypothetical protein
MTDFNKVFNIYSTEPGEDEQNENSDTDEVKRANASK